jgi:ATP-binding cassette subfamily C protein
LLPIPVTLLTARASIRNNRTITNLNGRLSGLVLQIIIGIGKLRVAGADGRALSAWGRDYKNMRRATFSATTSTNRLVVFNGTYPVLATLFIFAFAISPQVGQVSTGGFLAFFAAFSMLLAATLSLNTAFLTITGVVPVYERLRPILEAEPEVDDSKSDPGELSGAVEISNLSFRYHEEGPLILRNISLRIDPGEFVAIVGPSGSGKSTLFRLLMGFEKPEKGTVYYDGQDLDRLNIQAVRRQIGVVLQQSHASPTKLYKNIIGDTALTIEDAWEAARLAGMDKDIEQMPMGMHTQISEGGSTLSAGQRQRLLIAAAIAKRPRILYLDEASSALDNQTQAVVSQSLEQLEASRLIIAHRLSTIRHADRIYVLNRGELVQNGGYEELISQPGFFADLVIRQLVG